MTSQLGEGLGSGSLIAVALTESYFKGGMPLP
jgi:hypothetical protein